MVDNDGLIAGYILDGKGGGQKVRWKEIQEWTPTLGILWLHLNFTVPEAQRWIKEKSQLEDIVGDALLAEESRPRVTAFDDGLLIALRGVNLNPGADPEDMVSLRIWVEKNRIITTRRRKLMSVSDLISTIEKGKGPRTSGEFLEDIADRLMSRMGNVIDDLEDQVAELEEAVLAKESHERLNGSLVEDGEVIDAVMQFFVGYQLAGKWITAGACKIVQNQDFILDGNVSGFVSVGYSAICMTDFVRLAKEIDEYRFFRLYILCTALPALLPDIFNSDKLLADNGISKLVSVITYVLVRYF